MATNVKHTVQDILQIMADLRGESTVSTEAKRIRAIDVANKDFSRRYYWNSHLLIEQTQTADGSSSYEIGDASYPSRSKGLVEVFVDGTAESNRYEIIDRQSFRKEYNKDNTCRVVYEWYDVTNDKWMMRINPVPTTETITYSYYFEPATVTLTSDYVYCPNPKIIAYLALAELHEGEDENQEAIINKRDAEILIQDLMGLEMSPAKNQQYTFSTLANMSAKSYRIGDY